jgi:hypothetical protein
MQRIVISVLKICASSWSLAKVIPGCRVSKNKWKKKGNKREREIKEARNVHITEH